MKDKKKKCIILALKRAEELRNCYKLVRSVTKPQQSNGISQVKVPIENADGVITWKSVYDPNEIENLVLHQHRKHFSQAQGSPFTVEPLSTLVNDTADSPFAKQVLEGTADIDSLQIDKYTKDLLIH